MKETKEKKPAKEKKPISPNECSFARWLAVLAVSSLIGLVVFAPMEAAMKDNPNSFMGVSYEDIFGIVGLVPFFIGTVIALKLIAKTSLKDFILGVGGKFDLKNALAILGLYVGGFAVYHLIMFKNLSLRNVNPGHFAFLLLFALLTVWMQTTYEELIFRGIVLRWVCKNDIGYSKKSIIAALISSFAFMVMHLANPEVTSQKGIDIAIIACSYFFSGLFMFWADLHFKSLVPGIVIHWVNNFMLMSIISQEVSAVTAPTLIIDKTPKIAYLDLASVFIAYLPVIIYIVCDLIKRKKAAANQ
jgi:membrane protease YdiL (CAAX protease family)